MELRALLLLPLLLLLPGEARARQCAGVTMPETAAIDGKPLLLNGMGVREATVLNLDVYVAALYLERRSSDGDKIARSEQAKQMRLTFVRDVSRSDMVENMERGFRNGAGAEYGKLKPSFEQLKGWLPSLKSGDTFFVTYRPSKGLEIRHGKKLLGELSGADFARAIFLIWLGKNPPNPGLKAGLLGGRCG